MIKAIISQNEDSIGILSSLIKYTAEIPDMRVVFDDNESEKRQWLEDVRLYLQACYSRIINDGLRPTVIFDFESEENTEETVY